MTKIKDACLVLAALVTGLLVAPAQQTPSAGTAPASKTITLNVMVDNQSGQPVTDLNQADFKVLDNKSPRQISSFKVASNATEPVHVILFLDSVNMPYDRVAAARQGVDKFLRANGGKLAYPTTIAILGDDGIKVRPKFTTDGAGLSAGMVNYRTDLRQLNRATQYGDAALMQTSLTGLGQLLDLTQKLPGRKLVIWISPGWPMVSGPRVFLTWRQQNEIFSNIVLFSTLLRQNDVTMYTINPAGVSRDTVAYEDYYQSFLYGVTKPDKTQFGNLGLQVMSIHSGGVVIQSNSSIARYIDKCLQDAQSWYEISFTPLPGDKKDQYNHFDVKVDRPGLTVRNDDQYYANPVISDPRH
jgi:VWFA-related protein